MNYQEQTTVSPAQQQLLKKICQLDFVITEITLYLDNQPNDQGALTRLQAAAKEKDVLYKEYINNYGPIKAEDTQVGQGYLWAKQPFPWDI